jgi:hypothetical protein
MWRMRRVGKWRFIALSLFDRQACVGKTSARPAYASQDIRERSKIIYIYIPALLSSSLPPLTFFPIPGMTYGSSSASSHLAFECAILSAQSLARIESVSNRDLRGMEDKGSGRRRMAIEFSGRGEAG